MWAICLFVGSWCECCYWCAVVGWCGGFYKFCVVCVMLVMLDSRGDGCNDLLLVDSLGDVDIA